MNHETLSDALTGVNDRFLLEAVDYRRSAPRLRKLGVVVLAAALSLLLMGAAIWHENIQNTLASYWQVITGQTVTENHAQLLSTLTQEIHQSKTVNGITVTVDSATVGEDCFFLLLHVEGLEHGQKYRYQFDDIHMDVTPDPAQDVPSTKGIGLIHKQRYDDGSFSVLLDYVVADTLEPSGDTTPLHVELTLENLMPIPDTIDDTVEGIWEFSFDLERSQPVPKVTVPELVLAPEGASRAIRLTNLVLTNTEMRFQVPTPDGFEPQLKIDAILRDGSTLWTNCYYVPTRDNTSLYATCIWHVPIDPEEVAALNINGFEIPIP